MHEVLPKKIARSVSRYRAAARLRPEKRSSRDPRACSGLPLRREEHDEKSHDAGCGLGELASDRVGAGRALASATLLLRPEPGRRSSDDEGEICLDRRPAAAGQLSEYEPGIGGLERLLALRPRDLYLRFSADGHGGRSSPSYVVLHGAARPVAITLSTDQTDNKKHVVRLIVFVRRN